MLFIQKVLYLFSVELEARSKPQGYSHVTKYNFSHFIQLYGFFHEDATNKKGGFTCRILSLIVY